MDCCDGKERQSTRRQDRRPGCHAALPAWPRLGVAVLFHRASTADLLSDMNLDMDEQRLGFADGSYIGR